MIEQQQPDLFEAYARRTDRTTSHQAASSVEAALPELEGTVLHALRRAGSKGMTVDELTDELGMDKVTVSPRLAPLCRKGFAEAHPELKRPGHSGRSQTVWRVKV